MVNPCMTISYNQNKKKQSGVVGKAKPLLVMVAGSRFCH